MVYDLGFRDRFFDFSGPVAGSAEHAVGPAQRGPGYTDM
jgi:hypothetical protein